ncbi:hypothetical protein BLEM_0599 [Bifidobacterium lemurum]|uniref:Uncharacterized protein n=1 Tax=Bifidobacterium lemurum TaxID=1603886 RepID=A0A261FU24_9BIFI|nr:hypothetical protein [Bifidobacterium lemurum]OZG62682.1 hypothetical protein BLEM_0599 [Bifidobacterium lemurum]QOL34601.1 hypothetical protein BL8807_01305 [Bifidobacterium lemurum]
MPVFDGMEDAGRVVGYQERAIDEFTAKFRDEHDELDGYSKLLLSSLKSIAQNIDVQNRKGREISRNVASMLDLIRQLHEWDAKAATETGELPDETKRLLEAMSL